LCSPAIWRELSDVFQSSETSFNSYDISFMYKLPRYNCNIVECGIKHHKPNPLFTKTYTYLPIYNLIMLGISLSELCKWGSKKWRKASWIVNRFGKYRRKSKLNSEKIGKIWKKGKLNRIPIALKYIVFSSYLKSIEHCFPVIRNKH
jgi:hypothetical protein